MTSHSAEPKTVFVHALAIPGALLNTSVFFAGANLCNFAQAADPAASAIAAGNLAYVALLSASVAVIRNQPDTARVKQVYEGLVPEASGTEPQKDILRPFARFIANQLLSPLRMTAYCALSIGAVLFADAYHGVGDVILPAIAATAFGVGNFLQSSPLVQKLRDNPAISRFAKALTHPATEYGVGYTATGLAIGGGSALFADPLNQPWAVFLTGVGITEVGASLACMMTGKITNMAAPFMGVAGGTAFFMMDGLATGHRA